MKLLYFERECCRLSATSQKKGGLVNLVEMGRIAPRDCEEMFRN
jgi:hypothetical protein